MRIEDGSGPMDALLKAQTKKGFTPLKFFLFAVLLIILNGILQVLPDFPMKMGFSYFLGAVIIGSIIATIVTLKKAGSSYDKLTESLTNEPTVSEEVVLYETTNEGIHINYFNQTSIEQMLFISWSSMKEVWLGDMEYIYTESSSDSMKAERFKMNIRKKFKHAKMRLGDFPYEPKLSYDDVQAIYFKMGNYRTSELPIPPSWHQNGTYEQFVHEINQNLQTNIE